MEELLNSIRARLTTKRRATGVLWRTVFSIKDAVDAARIERRQHAALVLEVEAYRRCPPARRPPPLEFHLRSAVLKTRAEADAAIDEVRSLGLVPYDSPHSKDWDSLAALSAILQTTGPAARILDAGTVFASRILPWLSAYGYRNLIGINLSFESTERVGNIAYQRGDLTRTGFDDACFDAVACLSVIEHGVDIPSYFGEMWRILKPGGRLVTSTDYWPDRIETSDVTAFGTRWRIFDRHAMPEVMEHAARCGFVLDGELQLDAHDSTVAWNGREYTFIYFVLTKPALRRL